MNGDWGYRLPVLFGAAAIGILLVLFVVTDSELRQYQPHLMTIYYPTESAPLASAGEPIPERAAPPTLPAAVADVSGVHSSDGVQALVSYVDTGFEPRILAIQAGDTVRFVNNSTGRLWISASGDKLYPSVENGCGSSAFDSCASLSPGQYWEFTFDKKGTWQYWNGADRDNMGTVVVK